MLARSFRDLKYSDRFYYENSPQSSPYPFTPSQLSTIRTVRFSSILCSALQLTKVPRNAFLAFDAVKNPYVSCNSVAKLNLLPFRDSASQAQVYEDTYSAFAAASSYRDSSHEKEENYHEVPYLEEERAPFYEKEKAPANSYTGGFSQMVDQYSPDPFANDQYSPDPY